MQILQEQISVHVGNANSRCHSNPLIPAYVEMCITQSRQDFPTIGKGAHGTPYDCEKFYKVSISLYADCDLRRNA